MRFKSRDIEHEKCILHYFDFIWELTVKECKKEAVLQPQNDSPFFNCYSLFSRLKGVHSGVLLFDQSCVLPPAGQEVGYAYA